MSAERSRAAGRPLLVVAFGGNALLEPRDLGKVEEQARRAEQAAEWLAELVLDHEVVLVHGNGPQVGQILIQMEEAATKVPPGTLDVAVAQTQGGMGYLLELALRNRFREIAPERSATTVLSLVVVDRDDPGFRDPTKPIGPFFSRYRMETLRRELGWQMAEDAGRGWRKVVASPRPLEVLGLGGARRLIEAGHLVIVGGGGGIPVIRHPDGRLEGVEAVIDKDYTAALIADRLGAERLLILTGVAQVAKSYGKADEEPLSRIDTATARRLLEEGHFPPGSMGPKIRAAVEFVDGSDRSAVITDIDHLRPALAGRGGTTIVA